MGNNQTIGDLRRSNIKGSIENERNNPDSNANKKKLRIPSNSQWSSNLTEDHGIKFHRALRGRSSLRNVSDLQHTQTNGFDFDPLDSQKSENVDINKRQSQISIQSSSSNAILDYSTKQASLQSRIDADGEENEEHKLKEAGQLATVFLEMRESIMSLHNVDTKQNEKLGTERGPIKLYSHAKKVSRKTQLRAERVKAMLNLYYFSIFQAQKSTNPEFEGVDGIYNPLQIMRNRKLKKKYHQHHQVSIRTLPYASTAFSKRKDKLIWEMDLSELTRDDTWRTQHWNELVNSRGELWFPDAKVYIKRHHGTNIIDDGDNNDDDNSNNIERGLHNIHDKLFELNYDDYDHKRDTSTSRDSSRDGLSDRRSRSRNFNKRREKLPKHSKSPVDNSQSTQSLTKYLLVDEEQDESKPESNSVNGSSLSLKGKVLEGIQIEPIHRQADDRVSSKSESVIAYSKTIDTSLNPVTDDDREKGEYKELNEYLTELKNSKELLQLSDSFFNIKLLEYERAVKVIDFDSAYDNIEGTYKVIKDDKLQENENLINSKSEELDNLRNKLTNEYSKVDKLLLLSDRTIGEVNITLSLEFRKLTERFERLGPIHKRADSVVNFIYWILENLVVLLLWCIWIGFSVGRLVKLIIICAWKLFEWIVL
ncbi:hypothetical protein WICMUC_001543 [Wickerhamomyces mucosus]|uniref:Maintenance of telomere capping protein 4 n=1 Tax=Wickerhamomyces mucosus TaxID=1378264 RepID=A0A9P8TH02_9ASCO|nr:hypothetical protein WICMUC_001543 [Wickerhamomyces mucosus]